MKRMTMMQNHIEELGKSFINTPFREIDASSTASDTSLWGSYRCSVGERVLEETHEELYA